MSSDRDTAANRRRFLQYLASSPLLAAGGASAFAETLMPKAKLPDPLMWGPLDASRLIKSPKEAINVFDLEPVMRQNVPPAHFGYMASGIDDEVTLRRNREDFLKFQLRPRRLVDVSKVDMSVDILGTKYSSPIVCAPVGGQRSFHDEAESAVARAAKAGDHLQILSTMTSDPVEDVIKARGAPIWFQLYATNKWEVAAAITKRVENAGCTAMAVTVDRSGGRNQETLFRLRPEDKRDCNGCHDRTSLQSALKTRAMFKDVDITGLRNTQSSAMTWEFFKKMRDHTKMKLLAKGILAWEDAVLAADAGLDGIIVSNHGARSEEFRPLDHRRAAGDRRSGEGPHPDLRRLRLPPRLRHRQGAVHGGDGRLRRQALHLGPWRVRAAGRRARFGASPHRNLRYDAAGWRAERQTPGSSDGAAGLSEATRA